MFFTALIFSFLGAAFTQLPTFTTTKFRPSPVDQIGNLGLNQFSAADYLINLKAPSFQPTPYKDFQQYNTFPLASSRPLFTPAETQYPAETQGQIDNYNKALQEELEALQQPQQQPQRGVFNSGFSNGFAGLTQAGFTSPPAAIPPTGFNVPQFTSQGSLPLAGYSNTPFNSAGFNSGNTGFNTGLGKSYVNVRFGGPHSYENYHYTI